MAFLPPCAVGAQIQQEQANTIGTSLTLALLCIGPHCKRPRRSLPRIPCDWSEPRLTCAGGQQARETGDPRFRCSKQNADHLHAPVGSANVRLRPPMGWRKRSSCLGAVRGHARARAAGEVETAASAIFLRRRSRSPGPRDPFQNAEIYRVTPPDSFMLNASSCRTHFRRSPKSLFRRVPPMGFYHQASGHLEPLELPTAHGADQHQLTSATKA